MSAIVKNDKFFEMKYIRSSKTTDAIKSRQLQCWLTNEFVRIELALDAHIFAQNSKAYVFIWAFEIMKLS